MRGEGGALWYVRNGEILRIGNASKGWNRGSVDLEVNAAELVNVEHRALESIKRFIESEKNAELGIADVRAAGLASLGPSGATGVLRIVFTTAPGKRTDAEACVRRCLAVEFAEN